MIDRLRQLEERLNSLSSGNQTDIEPLREMIAGRESRRGKVYAEVLRNATAFALDLSAAIDAKVVARLDPIGDRAMAMLETRTPPVDFQPAERILSDQEARVGLLAKQFAEARKSAAKVEERLALAGDALDRVWKQQDAAGVGGWRMVMRNISANVELARESRPSLAEQYRGTAGQDQDIPVPAATIVCRRCKKTELRRVKRVSLLEELLRVASVSPYLCGNCGEHSYRFRYSIKSAG